MKRKQPNDKTSNYNLKRNVSVPECATAIILVPVFQYGGRQIFHTAVWQERRGDTKESRWRRGFKPPRAICATCARTTAHWSSGIALPNSRDFLNTALRFCTRTLHAVSTYNHKIRHKIVFACLFHNTHQCSYIQA